MTRKALEKIPDRIVNKSLIYLLRGNYYRAQDTVLQNNVTSDLDRANARPD